MERSEAESTDGAAFQVALVVAGTTAGTITLAWTAFLVWLVLKAFSVL